MKSFDDHTSKDTSLSFNNPPSGKPAPSGIQRGRRLTPDNVAPTSPPHTQSTTHTSFGDIENAYQQFRLLFSEAEQAFLQVEAVYLEEESNYQETKQRYFDALQAYRQAEANYIKDFDAYQNILKDQLAHPLASEQHLQRRQAAQLQHAQSQENYTNAAIVYNQAREIHASTLEVYRHAIETYQEIEASYQEVQNINTESREVYLAQLEKQQPE